MDLRRVTAQSRYLRYVARKFNLQPYEAVCFTNKARTRFRLIFRVNGGNDAVFLCIPEIDTKAKYGIYLRVSETLAQLTGVQDARVLLDELHAFTEQRIIRSRAWHAARGK